MGQRKFNGKNVLLIVITLLVGIVMVFFLSRNPEEKPVPDKFVEVSGPQEIVDGKHVATGLVADEGLSLVIAHCTGCHSAKLVTQNRFNSEGWIRVIRWMQKTQNLWDLGESEEAIVAYLSKHYAPEFAGRRMPLPETEWYELDEE
jgi:hypothetical protein